MGFQPGEKTMKINLKNYAKMMELWVNPEKKRYGGSDQCPVCFWRISIAFFISSTDASFSRVLISPGSWPV